MTTDTTWYRPGDTADLPPPIIEDYGGGSAPAAAMTLAKSPSGTTVSMIPGEGVTEELSQS